MGLYIKVNKIAFLQKYLYTLAMSSSEKSEREIYIWESNHIEDCQKINLFEEKDVLEVGGVLPKSYTDQLNAKSWTCIDIASYYESIKQGNYEVIRGNICDYDFGENTFDTVISTNSFEHINNFEKAIANIYKILKPSGILSALFGPIWSCNKGHHLWVYEGGRYITFNDDIIPDWSHLLYTESELKELIQDKYNASIQKEILNQTYYVDWNNRLFYEDYIRILNQFPFIIHELRNWHKPVFPPVDIQKRLEEKYPGYKNFHTFSLKILFQKDSNNLK